VPSAAPSARLPAAPPAPAPAPGAPAAATPAAQASALVPSPLSRRLADPGAADVRRAFELARRRFRHGARVEMGPLAAELGVDRTSLFRWVGNRDALLTEVLWSLAAPTLDEADARCGGSGGVHLGAVLTSFASAMITADYFRSFLGREPARAMRLLTTTSTQVQRRFTTVTELLVEREVQAGRFEPALPVHDLAYLLVRMSESFTYADLIAGEPPSAERAAAAFALLLRVPADAVLAAVPAGTGPAGDDVGNPA